MGTIAEKYIDEGRAEGVEFGKIEAKKELAMKLLKSGFPNEFVSENTGLSKQEILALKDSID
ncbi:hypothetical protein OCHUTO_0801 [Orientia chuto str. Dubai]|uniref:Transposase n=1 Tax=Orientia chuto str. Dubai TaxID=1359168 RepID=A0A0F3MIM6_9RICK|nr:hypothetical protein [Candidatus Orientia mediorientalis]KJV55585.1 hypothetical protein OCHUTO_0801 [Orientia chuto str. Dubai]